MFFKKIWLVMCKIRAYIWGTLAALVIIGLFTGFFAVIGAGVDNFIKAIQETRDKQLRFEGCKKVLETGQFKGRELLDLRDQCREIINKNRTEQQVKQDEKIQEFLDAMQEVR